MLQAGDEVEPVSNAILYLARIIIDSSGEERVASFNRLESPRTVSGAEGEFAFLNVEPGRYGLVLDIVVESFLLSNPENGEDLIATVEAGGEFNFGDLVYEELPILQ